MAHRQGNRRRRTGFTAGELRIMLLGGIFAGLVVSQVPGGRVPRSSAAASVHFGLCHSGGGVDCVVDGDTFWMGGEKIRLADIDTPETHPPRCAEEAELGERATLRLQALLNAGAVTLVAESRDTDRYGRKLRVAMRDGESLGDTLVAEGLARRWTGSRRPWCQA